MKVSSNLIFSDDKKKKKIQKITLKLILPAGEAKNNSVLGPLLGQHQINIMSFCNEFNVKSVKDYVSGIPLPVSVEVGKDRTYGIKIRYPYLSLFINQISETKNFNEKILKISFLYDVLKIFSFFLNRDELSIALLIFGYLTSGNKKYIYKFVF
jgi:ribosomal protein L11